MDARQFLRLLKREKKEIKESISQEKARYLSQELRSNQKNNIHLSNQANKCLPLNQHIFLS